jgi:polyphosphate kinase
MLDAIHGETEAARAGKPARIIAKMNSLLEPEIISALYEASAAGVTVDLIVRGVCSLRPGVKGLSENIQVRSVIGRFLEHHRIFYFHADGKQNIYLSSADWMERNFFRRIEISFPVLEPKLKQRVLKEGLKPYLADNCQAWEMDGSGEYRIKPTKRSRISAQELLLADLGVSIVSVT